MQYLIWLTATAALPPQKAWALLSAFGSGKTVFDTPVDKLSRAVPLSAAERLRLRLRTLGPAQSILERCKRGGIRVLSILEPDYPQRLKNIYDPPVLLYVRGELPDLSRLPSITVVGTRRCTPYGAMTAERMAYQLSRSGVVVVSGMADGVDSAAHRGALKGDTPTVAVFGTAIDGCYPAHNGGLLRDILRHGAAVSEYPPGVRAPKGSFPRRNRIMSGLSLGVLVAEAPARSGSLITAGLALDQGRDVFAIPGSIDAPASAGTNELIRNGATLVREAGDILREYAAVYDFAPAEKEVPPVEETVAAAYAPPERAPQAATGDPVLDALADGPLPLEDLLRRAGLEPTEGMARVTLLELTGKLRQLPGKLFERI